MSASVIYMLALLPYLILAGSADGRQRPPRDMLQSTADAAALAGALKLPVSARQRHAEIQRCPCRAQLRN